LGVAYLKDATGEVIKTIPLSLQEGMDQILPSHSGYLVGDGWLVDSGAYTVEIRVLNEDVEIASAEQSLLVP
jgi:hypothetical protein